jgi:hypothetical protein
MTRSSRTRAVLSLGILATGFALAGCHDDSPTVVRDATAPAAPQGLYSVTGDGRVTLYWIKNTEPDFREYIVWRGPAFDGPYNSLGRTTNTSFVDNTAVNGVTYYYAVSALDLSGNESDLSHENVNDTPRPEGTNLSLVDSGVNPDGPAGYDFSTGTRKLASDPATDVYFTLSSGTRLLVARDLDTDVQDAGFHSLDELDWAPPSGWSPTGTVEAIAGHSYYVWTRDNHYAKLYVASVDNSHVVLDWAYQIDGGNPQLRPRLRERPTP